MAKRIRIRRKKKQEQEPVPFDLIQEQLEGDFATAYCKQAEKDIYKVRQHPEHYIEVNIIKNSRLVDTFYISAENKYFNYKSKKYNITEDGIYLLPQRSGFFIPTVFYYESNSKPVGFKQTNKGITGKALSLMYQENLYTTLLHAGEDKYNLLIVILTIGVFIAYGILLYLLFMHGNGGVLGQGSNVPPVSPQVIMPAWWGW
jgi:hypothetical protein